MAVLITGGLGHIGSYVAEKLARHGEMVIVFDEHAAGFDDFAPDYLRKVRGQLFLESGSVTDFDQVKAVFEKHKGRISSVIHLAGLGGVEAFVNKPHGSVYLNVAGTLNVLEASRLSDVNRFVYISSGAVYGQRMGILRESDAYRADDLYGASKISGELLTLQYGKTFGMECCCARVYFVYGPGRMPSVMYSLYKGLFGPLEGINGGMTDIHLDQQLDFTYIDDTAEGIVRICLQRELSSTVYNISSGQSSRIGEVAQAVREWSGMHGDALTGGNNTLKRGAPLDISLAVKELGYKPNFVDIREGIREYGVWINRQKGKR